MLSFLVSDQDRKMIGDGLETLSNIYSILIKDADAEVELTLVEPVAMREINLRYRRIDRTTDVLSFPIFEHISQLPTEQLFLLGSIAICPEQAKKYEEPLIDLVHHGFLHLLGFDHETDRPGWDSIERQAMSLLDGSGLAIAPAPH